MLVLRFRHRVTRTFRVATMLGWMPLQACSEVAPGGLLPAAVTPEESPALFEAAIRHFAARTDERLRVDPRPLRPEARLHQVLERDLLPDRPEIVRMRNAVIEAGRWGVADAVADSKCMFVDGLPPPRPPGWQPPDSVRLFQEQCRRNRGTESLVFGLPQAENDPGHPNRWRMSAMRMLLFGYEGFDLVLERDAFGEWRVVEVRERTGVFS